MKRNKKMPRVHNMHGFKKIYTGLTKIVQVEEQIGNTGTSLTLKCTAWHKLSPSKYIQTNLVTRKLMQMKYFFDLSGPKLLQDGGNAYCSSLGKPHHTNSCFKGGLTNS